MRIKIKYKLMAALMAAISLFSLTFPASAAWTGLAGGATGDGGFRLTQTPYGYIKTDPMAWRADLYVSANTDGKINKSSDTIGSSLLPLVGSILCVSPTYGTEWWKTYLQTNYTNSTRDQFNSSGCTSSGGGENIGSVQYTLPTLKEFDPADGIYTDASGHTVVIANTGDVKLFEGQYGLSTDFSVVQQRLTGTDAGYYTSQLLNKYLGIVGLPVLDKLKLLTRRNDLSYPDIIKYTYPVRSVTNGVPQDNPDCMVEWALVVTPIYRFECGAPFYCSAASAGIASTNYGLPYVGGYNCVALDAYWFAQSERTTLALGKDGKYAGLTYTGSDGTVKNVWQNQSIGLLSFFLENNAGAVGSAAYCAEEGKNGQYLGVWTNVAKTTTQSGWASLLKTQPSEYAKRGGIAVFTTKITTPEAPVYYHTYTYEIDENNPPDGYTVGTAYPQEQLLKFIDKLPEPTVTVTKGSAPTEEYYCPTKDTEATSRGVPVAAMTPNPTIAQPGATKSDYPTYTDASYYLQKYPWLHIINSTNADIEPIHQTR